MDKTDLMTLLRLVLISLFLGTVWGLIAWMILSLI